MVPEGTTQLVVSCRSSWRCLLEEGLDQAADAVEEAVALGDIDPPCLQLGEPRRVDIATGRGLLATRSITSRVGTLSAGYRCHVAGATPLNPRKQTNRASWANW